MKTYYVYIMASKGGALYTGVSGDLGKRVYEHKHGKSPGFTSKYKINRLVYFEETVDITEAIAREKQIKGWLRKRKIALIKSANPTWSDLSEGWVEEEATASDSCHSERPEGAKNP